MPKTSRPPSYRFHKARKCAVVTLGGQNHYLGKYGSPESHQKYARLIAGYEIGSPVAPVEADAASNGSLIVSAIILHYLEFASKYYRKHGKPTGELDNIRCALAALKKLFGRSPVDAFSPKSLELVRQSMIAQDLARRTINSRISRIKRMFRWASKEGLVPGEMYYSLLAVDGLKMGRSAARETGPVRPVMAEHVRMARAHLNAHVSAMIQIQELTGMRPQEIRNVRTCDIDQSGEIWIYVPWTHKTEHHGHVRSIAIGPKAQKILRPFLKPRWPMAFVFSPRDAVEEIHRRKAESRKSRRTPSQVKRVPKSNPRRSPAEQYSKDSYNRAVARACQRASVPAWNPNQLRHNCATKVRRLYGLDGAAAVLGHRLGTVTEVYAEADLQKAIDIMRAIG